MMNFYLSRVCDGRTGLSSIFSIRTRQNYSVLLVRLSLLEDLTTPATFTDAVEQQKSFSSDHEDPVTAPGIKHVFLTKKHKVQRTLTLQLRIFRLSFQLT